VRDVEGVDGEEEEEEREREIESVVHYSNVCICSSPYNRFLPSLFCIFFVIPIFVNDLDKMHKYCVVLVHISSSSP